MIDSRALTLWGNVWVGVGGKLLPLVWGGESLRDDKSPWRAEKRRFYAGKQSATQDSLVE